MTDLIAADFGIRQNLALFSDAVWRQDHSDFAACFAKDGVWKIAGQVFTGRDAIREASSMMLGRCDKIHLVTGQPILQAEGDEVLSRLQLTEFAWMPDGTQFITFGIYHDRFVEEDGRWVFAHRHWAFKYRGPIDLSAPPIDTPDYGSFPARPAPDEPTYVRKA